MAREVVNCRSWPGAAETPLRCCAGDRTSCDLHRFGAAPSVIGFPSTAKQETQSDSVRSSGNEAMSYLFPLSFVFNSLATMGLLIGLSLVGKSLIAADIGIVHGATLALFF